MATDKVHERSDAIVQVEDLHDRWAASRSEIPLHYFRHLSQ
jgi:hypothetical protein